MCPKGSAVRPHYWSCSLEWMDTGAEFQTEEANPVLWLEPRIRGVYDDVDSLIGRLAQ